MNRHLSRLYTPLIGMVIGLLCACQNTAKPSIPPSLNKPTSTSSKIVTTAKETDRHKAQITPLFQVIRACGGTPWPNVVWVHVHENETTSWQVAQAVLAEQHMGCVYGLQHGGSRNVVAIGDHGRHYRFDPNRMFTQRGLHASLRQFDGDNPAVATRITLAANHFYQQYLQGKQLIVAVHNNRPSGYSIHSYNNGSLVHNALNVAINPQRNPDDFFYVVNQRAFVYFSRLGFNVVLQHPDSVNDDGSLSVYAAQQGQDYINVEAGFGHIAAQTAMLEAVLAYMHDYYSVNETFPPETLSPSAV